MTRGIPGTRQEHGTKARRLAGCTCGACRHGQYVYDKTRHLRPGYVDRAGTVRRLQALAAIGWPQTHLGARMGISAQAVSFIVMGRPRDRVEPATAERVARLYDELSMTPGPSRVARDRALARGWAPPLAWDDDTIDDPGAKPMLGKASRWLDLNEWCHLVRYGELPEVAAERCGVTFDAVEAAIARQDHAKARRLLDRARAVA